MKRQWIFSLLILLLMPGLSIALSDTPNVPYNVTLTSTDNTITVDWTGDSNADGYYVYYGTTSGNLDLKETVSGTSTTIVTISGLTPGTTYYVSVSAYNDSEEGNRSDVKSIATTKDIAKPLTPEGLDVVSVQNITENSVVLKWDRNSESDLDHYTIYYGTASGSTDNVLTAQDADASSFTISTLAASTRYYFTISASDTAGNESDPSKSLIVDTLTDTLPPNPPAKISGYLSDLREITITIEDGNEQMADFKGNILFYGTTSGNLDQQVDLGNGFTYTMAALAEDSTWYFSALSYDSHGNESQRTAEASAVVEKTERYLNQPDDFDGGCFIASAADIQSEDLGAESPAVTTAGNPDDDAPALETTGNLVQYVPANKIVDPMGANIAGIFAGYYLPVESQFEDYYGDHVLLVSAFYERQFNGWVSMDVEGGFMKEKGHLLTASGTETGIGSKLTLVPVALSLNIYHELTDGIVGYAGAGPDYWYCQEETDAEVYPEVEEWVGGCHAKAGVKLYNTDETYRNTGAIIETSYSWITRMGDNDTDLGGWAFKFGLFYQF